MNIPTVLVSVLFCIPLSPAHRLPKYVERRTKRNLIVPLNPVPNSSAISHRLEVPVVDLKVLKFVLGEFVGFLGYNVIGKELEEGHLVQVTLL